VRVCVCARVCVCVFVHVMKAHVTRPCLELQEQQCTLSENFGAGKLHSTHGVHPEAPCRDIFRLSNDPNHGFNSVVSILTISDVCCIWLSNMEVCMYSCMYACTHVCIVQGPEWHNDGSFCREVFGHVVYHIIKAPSGAGDTQFAHLGIAYDKLPSAAVKARLERCVSVNSNGGMYVCVCMCMCVCVCMHVCMHACTYMHA
jgi:taurine dioxygenase